MWKTSGIIEFSSFETSLFAWTRSAREKGSGEADKILPWMPNNSGKTTFSFTAIEEDMKLLYNSTTGRSLNPQILQK
jgi:hypothetical protein